MVSEKGLKKFKALYKNEFDIELEKKELIEKANQILNLYKSVYLGKNININQNNEEKIQLKKNRG